MISEDNETDFGVEIKKNVREFPQDVDLEKCVLGAIILEKDAILNVERLINQGLFYSYANREVYNAINTLFNSGSEIDLITVINQLQKNGSLEKVGGKEYVVSLTQRVVSGENIKNHCLLLLEYAIRRELICIVRNILEKAYDQTVDVFNLIDISEKSLLKISSKNIKTNYEKIGELVEKTVEEMKEKGASENEITGLESGFTELDKITCGFQKSDLIVVAARPGMGKTAFTLSIAINVAIKNKIPLAIFSLEMSSKQLVSRIMSSVGSIEMSRIIKGNFPSKKDPTFYESIQLKETKEKISNTPIFIDDTSGLSIFELRSKCRQLKLQHDIQLVIVDYLQLLTYESSKNNNREQEISSITRMLKLLAKELDIPIIITSQLSRAVETRNMAKKQPMLSDLRESGAIEQDADIVMFLYRPEYYGMLYENENTIDVEGITEVTIAKHRNGQLGTVCIKFVGKYVRFENVNKQ